MRSEHQNGIVTGNGALTEQVLRASELSCRRLFEAAQDGNLITDRKRAEETVRESERHFQTLPEDREKIVQGWQAATQAQDASKADCRLVRPDGTISWVMGLAVPEKDDAGRITGYVGTINNRSHSKQ